jgi:hypothetical protein
MKQSEPNPFIAQREEGSEKGSKKILIMLKAEPELAAKEIGK